ncbi:scarecrow-like protein 6 [Ipomoea triloba]|uniref:scarecrow-like protein 6 n=1 Tax=Ipomoea triloba TaxID=35885 RepID=UPI00125CE26D|nr:scarecrow-like protein 6 [Ipomoea triloba]
MKGMPFPFEFERKGVIELGNRNHRNCVSGNHCWDIKDCVVGSPGGSNSEPTSVLDRPLASSSTLSSSCGGGGGGETDAARVAAVSGNPASKWQQDNTTATSSNAGGGESELLQPVPPSLDFGGGGAAAGAAVGGGETAEKCGMEEWDSVLSESPGQEPLLRWIMGDVDDPSMANLNKVLQVGGGGAAAEYDFNGGFGVVDHGFGPVDPVSSSGESFLPSIPISGSNFPANRLPNPPASLPGFKFSAPPPLFPPVSNNLGAAAFNPALLEPSDLKPQIFNPGNPHFLINQPPQNPSFLMPLPFSRPELAPPQAKRHNPGGNLESPGPQIPRGLFSDQQTPSPHHVLPHQLQLLPNYPQRPKPPEMAGEEMGHFHQNQQTMIDQLFKTAELVQSGNPILAQGILARLNHHLSPIGKPFQRAAFYCKESLQLLLQHATNNNMNPPPSSSSVPFSLIFKIGAYKSFSEISPVSPFANFTCNQALLEALEGFDRIRIVDFDIGYGGQWASLMQELALRSGGSPSLKITVLASPAMHDQLELGLTRENLIHFASEINMAFEFEVLSIDSLNSTSWSLPLHVSDNEAIAVNLPVGCFTTYQLSHPLVLRFVKQLMPKIVVSVDRVCDRTDLLFPNHVIHALQYYANLLESLDAVNVNFDALQKIERFLLHPGIEKIIMGRYRSPEKTQHWRTLFLSSGFSPLTFSNFTESQAECVVKRTPVRGFHVEKRQSSLVLCWQRKELISVSAWRC